MKNEVYNLYIKCLPDIIRDRDTVRDILGNEKNHVIEQRENGVLAGVSVINENTILLLCVDSPFQNRGIGSELLKQSEQYIFSCGFEKITLGAGKDYIMPGVPMNGGVHGFFARRGYINSWGESGCFDMILDLNSFTYSDHCIGDKINEINYRWAVPNDLGDIKTCVTDAEESFVQYYADESLYDADSTTRVLIAEKCGEIIATVMVNIEVEREDLGSLACTATMRAHRGKGIATNLVSLGTKHMKSLGLSEAFLSYTYTEIVGMYGRVGYKIYMEYFMGEKWNSSI